MTRILPLIPLLLWLMWHDEAAATVMSTEQLAEQLATPVPWLGGLWMYLGVLILIAAMVLWSRLLLVAHRDSYAAVPTRAFHLALFFARVASVVWFGVALNFFGYGDFVEALLRPIAPLHIRLPSIVLATFPAVISWFGLAWAAYPIDRATREQNLLAEIDAGLTPRSPPTLSQSLSSNFRMQVLFLLAPVLAVATLQDAATLAFRAAGYPLEGMVEGAVFVAASLFVFIASPELLVSVLRARPLADSALRRRLETLARRLDLRYRDILVWHTSYGIGNAAVMGLLPRFRYILLTDLLIETLDDEQIEAVFAHEAGHVKHRHLLWYVAFWAMFLLCLIGPSDTALRLLDRASGVNDEVLKGLLLAATFTTYLALFGALSRLFERQADVFAARSIQSLHLPIGMAVRSAPMATPVGSIGAESFVSALCRVAEISHRPVVRQRPRARNLFAASIARMADIVVNFTHPSIPDRIDHLRGLATTPALTLRFDRKVVLVMLGMLFVLMTLSTWVIVEQVSHRGVVQTEMRMNRFDR